MARTQFGKGTLVFDFFLLRPSPAIIFSESICMTYSDIFYFLKLSKSLQRFKRCVDFKLRCSKISEMCRELEDGPRCIGTPIQIKLV